MSEAEQNDNAQGMSFIKKLIIGKLILIAIAGIAVYFSLQGI